VIESGIVPVRDADPTSKKVNELGEPIEEGILPVNEFEPARKYVKLDRFSNDCNFPVNLLLLASKYCSFVKAV
jgi:hypothetical protein